MNPQHLLSSLRSAAAGVIVALTIAPVSTAQTPAAPPQAKAAGTGLPMWVIRDADSTIYITGTVHILPDGVNWHSERLDAALNDARELYLELAEIAAPDGLDAMVEPVLEEFATWDGPPLSTMLTEKERALLADGLQKAHTPPEMVAKTESMQPWYAAYALGRRQIFGDNYKEENGIDEGLAKIAVARGIPVKGMEEIKDQIVLMTGLDPDDQVVELKALLAFPEDMRRALERVSNVAYGGWARGETNAVEGLALMMGSGPDSDAVLLDRNENWAGKIEEILQGSGVSFIAVGALHLVGPNSLQSRLKLRGITAERY